MHTNIINVYYFYKELYRKIHSYGSLNEDEIVRCIYLMIGKRVGLNYSYHRSDAIKKWSIEQAGYSETEKGRKDIAKRVISEDTLIGIESEVAILLEVVGKRFGVDIKVVKDDTENTKPRFYNLVTRKDGSAYYVNLSRDLINIQTNGKTAYFGIDENGTQVISDERLNDMDLLLGYISEERHYAEGDLDKLKERVASIESFPAKMNYTLSHISINPDERLVGYDGIRKRHTDIIEKVTGQSEGTEWEFVDCYSYDKYCNKVYKPIIMVRDGIHEHYYIYSEEQRIYQEDRKAIEKELESGLVVPNMYVLYKGLYEIAAELSKGKRCMYGYDPRDNYH